MDTKIMDAVFNDILTELDVISKKIDAIQVNPYISPIPDIIKECELHHEEAKQCDITA